MQKTDISWDRWYRRLGTMLTIVLLAGCSRTADRVPPNKASAEPELVRSMGQAQRFSQKLGLAIRGRNRPLAEFYVEELAETLKWTADRVPESDGYPVARLIRELALPAVEQLDEALGLRSWDGIEGDFGKLIETCNSCHAATEHEYLIILPYADADSFNQLFDAP